jgi:plasmid maintenance system antidote protein VapI
VTVPEHVGVILSMVLDDRRISANRISETLGIFREIVSNIIYDI